MNDGTKINVDQNLNNLVKTKVDTSITVVNVGMLPDYLKYTTIIIDQKHHHIDGNNLVYKGDRCYLTHVLDVNKNSTRNREIIGTINPVLLTHFTNTPF